MQLPMVEPRLPHHPVWAATRLLLVLMCLAILPACGLSTPPRTTSSATVSGTSGTSPVAFVYTTCTCSASSTTSTASLVGTSAHDGSIVWRDTLGQQIADPIMVGDTLYARVTLDSTHPTPDIVAVRVATGRVLWRTNLPVADINCCVINADTTTVVVDEPNDGLNHNGLYALNPHNGTIRWHLPVFVEGRPLVHAGVVYAQVDPEWFSFASLNAYRASDGTRLWS